jgi:hypothetical protein
VLCLVNEGGCIYSRKWIGTVTTAGVVVVVVVVVETREREGGGRGGSRVDFGWW